LRHYSTRARGELGQNSINLSVQEAAKTTWNRSVSLTGDGSRPIMRPTSSGGGTAL
jgi:hypothetical protein